MKKNLLLIVSIIVLFLSALVAVKASAEEIVTITVIPQATPIPMKAPIREKDELPSYRIESSDVKILAMLLWSSPLRKKAEKVKLVWVVLNRVDDDSGLFGNSIKECVTKSEFTFYDRHARVSDTNKEIVEEVLNEWLAEKDGYYIGRRPPRIATYIRFVGDDNRAIELMGTPGGEALEW